MLTIGEFSRICFVSKKTLRHYDEIGLLRPEYTGENGYRYYTAAQLRTMLFISRLKQYGFSLPEIAQVLANPDQMHLAGKLEEKRRQMDTQLWAMQQVVQQMEQDIHKLKRRMDIMDQGRIIVKTVELQPQALYGIRKKIDVKQFPELFAKLFQDIQQKGLKPTGAPMAFYHNDEFDEGFDQENADVEVAVPVASKETRQMDGGLHCCTILTGPYVPEAFTAAYAGLCQWIEDNGYRIAGAPFDKYLQGGPGVAPEEYVTEIYFPIEK